VDAAKVAEVVSSKEIMDACQAISITAWREAGWQVRSLTGLHAGQSEGDPAAAAVLPPAGGP
jgi:hypothetical protein